MGFFRPKKLWYLELPEKKIWLEFWAGLMIGFFSGNDPWEEIDSIESGNFKFIEYKSIGLKERFLFKIERESYSRILDSSCFWILKIGKIRSLISSILLVLFSSVLLTSSSFSFSSSFLSAEIIPII